MKERPNSPGTSCGQVVGLNKGLGTFCLENKGLSIFGLHGLHYMWLHVGRVENG